MVMEIGISRNSTGNGNWKKCKQKLKLEMLELGIEIG